MNTEKLVFTEEEWIAEVPGVTSRLHQYLSQFTTPISKDHGDYGEAWGSGVYLRVADQVFILTNEHVARARTATQRLLYKLNGRDDLFAMQGNHVAFPWPLDLALLPVDAKVWSSKEHDSKAISIAQISIAHSTAPTELLAFGGFSGERSSFHFEMLFTPGTSSVSREVALPEGDDRFDPRFHFGLDYKPDLATSVVGNRGLPLPPGFSGSVVWNSGFVESRVDGKDWVPELARVTGIVWGWPSTQGCLVATRSEYIRSFLLGVQDDLQLT